MGVKVTLKNIVITDQAMLDNLRWALGLTVLRSGSTDVSLFTDLKAGASYTPGPKETNLPGSSSVNQKRKRLSAEKGIRRHKKRTQRVVLPITTRGPLKERKADLQHSRYDS